MDPASSDGTSQAARRWPALDPAFALVDERSTLDLLVFARALAAELKYVDAGGAEAGDWRGLLPPLPQLADAVDCLADPGRLSPDRALPYARPHVALLLAFLDLLGVAREQLNRFGQRHLDHFYATVLRMTRKRAVADRVHVLVEPAARSAAVEIPAGALLRAGKDSLGRDRVYATAAALVLHPLQVAALKSLRTDIRRTGLREASLQYLIGGTRAEAFVAMMRIALGQPDPGGALPTPLCAGIPAVPGSAIGFDQLVAAHDRLERIGSEIGMALFDDYRRLIALRASRLAQDAEQWAFINQLLEQAGKARSGDPGFVLPVAQADDFATNLRNALGLDASAFARLFDGLPEVKRVEEAYAVLDDRPDVQAFVTGTLHLGLDPFRSLVAAKLEIDGEWAQIVALVEAAARAKAGDPDLQLTEAQRQLRDVEALLAAAIGFRPAEGLDAFHAAFVAIEGWFCMSAERIDYLMGVGRRAAAGDVDAATWDKVYALCAQAHEALVYRLRRDALSAAAQPGIAANDVSRALAAMLVLVLGESLELSDAMSALAALQLNPADAMYLGAITRPGVAAATVDWPRVATVLELAQRGREQFVPSVAEQVVWRHLYAADDATSVLAPTVQSGEMARWKTFGSPAAAVDPATAPPALIGWALASPLLSLAEGTRVIGLRLGFMAQGFDVAGLRRLLAPDAPDAATTASVNPFVVQLSTAKGWVEPSCSIGWAGPAMDGYPAVAGIDTRDLRSLLFTLKLDDKQAALVPPALATHGMDQAAPVLRLLLRPVWRPGEAAWVTAYPQLHTLDVARAALSVSVSGLASLALRNDQGVLDPKKPFEPFGAQPASGSRLLIGHPELVAKPLASLGFRFRWMGAPAAFGTHYTNYPGGLGNGSFNARVGLQDGSLFAPATATMSFFDADTAAPVTRVVALPADPGAPAAALTPGSDVGRWNRCIVWELGQDFQHSVYPTLVLQNSLAMASAVAAGSKPDGAKFQINPPYTPKLKSLVVDYGSSLELALADAPALGVQVLHIHPFGAAPALAELVLADAPGSVTPPRPAALLLLPHYDGEGALYIGLAGVRAPQVLALLLQVAEGSADPDVAPAAVQWSCLDGDRWVSLQDGALLEDGSHGLINSGIVRFALPPVAPSTRLPGAATAGQPGGMYWLRAAIDRASAGVCDMVAIHPNAVVATFVDQDNAGDHLAAALPPQTITQLVRPLPGVARLVQPYSSFGGKRAEADADFALRVSERLRHKQRALTAWDYERLLLEKFPLLHKVKCLRADADTPPGQVDLIVVPDITDRFPFDPFEPKVPADVMRDIEAFLADKTPPFATVRVRNAFFVPLKIRCGVRFMPGSDEGFCRQRLNDELNRYLSPWAYDEGADLVIGGAIYANSIIDFIDARDYVDYIAELRLFLTVDGRDTLIPEAPDYRAALDRPDGVLVAARQHEFDVISHADYRVDGFGGINYMKIELDFIVS